MTYLDYIESVLETDSGSVKSRSAADSSREASAQLGPLAQEEPCHPREFSEQSPDLICNE